MQCAIEELRLEFTDAVLRVLAGEVARFTLLAAAERRRDGRLEFHDLLVLARSLLRRSGDARTALHERYSRLLIDEFQDTDPIQIELSMLIAASVGGGTVPDEWSDIAVDRERLFFVGDPKQSIYRFRRADIGLFLEARERFANEAVRLTTNFRTVPTLVAWVNEVFGGLMAEERPGQQPRYEPLAAHRDAHPAGHRVQLLGRPHLKDEKLRAARCASSRPPPWPTPWPGSWPIPTLAGGGRRRLAAGAPRGHRDPAADAHVAWLSHGRLTCARGVDFRAETGTLVYRRRRSGT